jgi:hypothetical protein
MAGIARNIELYNSAYRLAWEHIPERHNRTSLGVFTIASGARLRRGQA